MLVMFEQRPLQRPVKIAYSVYCVFDPVGNTLESQRGEAKWILFLPEENSHLSHFQISEHCLSRALVLLYPLINCCAETDESEQRTLKGRVEERGERL